jgi:hypothetical protein
LGIDAPLPATGDRRVEYRTAPPSVRMPDEKPEAVLLGEGEQGEAAVAMLEEEGLDLVPGPARTSRRGAGHGVLGLHPPMPPDHPVPAHDGPAGRVTVDVLG